MMLLKYFIVFSGYLNIHWFVFIFICLGMNIHIIAGPIDIVQTLYSPASYPNCISCEDFCAKRTQINSSLTQFQCPGCQCEPSGEDLSKETPQATEHTERVIPVYFRLHCYFLMCPKGCRELGSSKIRYGCKFCACGTITKHKSVSVKS